MSLDTIRQESWTQALHCFGTSYVFEARANRLRRRIRFLTFLGIAVPASVGAVVAAFGVGSQLTAVFLVIASILGLVQLIGSVWALVYRWDDDYGYAIGALSANRVVSDKFRALGQAPPATEQEASIQFKMIETECNARSIADEQQGITDDEKRMGMRAALRQFQRACAACGQVPTSMEPTNCGVCGSFKARRF